MRALIALADKKFRVALIFAAATDVRAGELHALRWRHVDFERREVRVETRVDPYGTEDVPKTKAGLRTIPLGETVLAALTAWRSVTRFAGKNDLIFPNKLGTYRNHDDMVKRNLPSSRNLPRSAGRAPQRAAGNLHMARPAPLRDFMLDSRRGCRPRPWANLRRAFQPSSHHEPLRASLPQRGPRPRHGCDFNQLSFSPSAGLITSRLVSRRNGRALPQRCARHPRTVRPYRPPR